MARPLWIPVPVGWYQVMSRGNGGDAVYRNDKDRPRFLGRVAELPERLGMEIHAFVVTNNRSHRLVRCRRLGTGRRGWVRGIPMDAWAMTKSRRCDRNGHSVEPLPGGGVGPIPQSLFAAGSRDALGYAIEADGIAIPLLAGHGMAAILSRRWGHLLCFAGTQLMKIHVIGDLQFPGQGLIRVDRIDPLLV